MSRCNPKHTAGAMIAALALIGGAEPAAADGLRTEPRLGWSRGAHAIELPIEVRYRFEDWKAFAPGWDGFHAVRNRLAFDYRYEKRLRFFAQTQQTSLFDFDAGASGVSALYRANTRGGREGREVSLDLSQLFVQWNPTDASALRVGREAFKLGTHVAYPEPNWKFLRVKRLSQRLLGPVGWTSARSYDGGTARVELAGHTLLAFAFEPTTGVFEVDGGYERQHDVVVGGLDWIARRGTWFENTEISAAFIAYHDDRDPSRVAGLFGEIEVYTVRASWLGVYEHGPGRIDLVLWGAFQWGDYEDAGPGGSTRRRDQLAGAAIAEVGYQMPDWWGAPWLRVGVNFASGDDDPSDRDRSTFFNILPTNHLYYGGLDQFAFQNLLDVLVQLKWSPLAKLAFEITYHRFRLAEDEDARWAGTGAFSRRNLGYVRNPSRGSRDAGRELDATVAWRPHRALTLSGGYSRLWGGNVFAGRDARWVFTQIELRY